MNYRLLEKSKDNPEAIEGYVHEITVDSREAKNKIKLLCDRNQIDHLMWDGSSHQLDNAIKYFAFFYFKNEVDATYAIMINS